MRHQDGSAGDADYGRIGQSYSSYRQPDPRIATMIAEALGAAKTVLNVGAAAGSYEPEDREVTAVEPSASMRAQRPRSEGNSGSIIVHAASLTSLGQPKGTSS